MDRRVRPSRQAAARGRGAGSRSLRWRPSACSRSRANDRRLRLGQPRCHARADRRGPSRARVYDRLARAGAAADAQSRRGARLPRGLRGRSWRPLHRHGAPSGTRRARLDDGLHRPLRALRRSHAASLPAGSARAFLRHHADELLRDGALACSSSRGAANLTRSQPRENEMDNIDAPAEVEALTALLRETEEHHGEYRRALRSTTGRGGTRRTSSLASAGAARRRHPPTQPGTWSRKRRSAAAAYSQPRRRNRRTMPTSTTTMTPIDDPEAVRSSPRPARRRSCPKTRRDQRQRQDDHAERRQHAEESFRRWREHRLVGGLEPLDDLLEVLEHVPDALRRVVDVVEVDVERRR